MPPEFMDTTQIARYLKCSIWTIQRYRKGVGVKNPIPFIRLTNRKIVYNRAEVRRWLLEKRENEHSRVPSSDA